MNANGNVTTNKTTFSGLESKDSLSISGETRIGSDTITGSLGQSMTIENEDITIKTNTLDGSLSSSVEMIFGEGMAQRPTVISGNIGKKESPVTKDTQWGRIWGNIDDQEDLSDKFDQAYFDLDSYSLSNLEIEKILQS